NINPQSIRDGQQRIAALRTEFDQFTVAQRTLVDHMRAEALRAGQWALMAGIGGLLVSLFAVALLTRSLAGMVARRAHRLVSAAGKVADGDLDVRIATDGPVEIGKMQRTFNSMVDALQRSRATLSTVAAEQAALRRVATVAARGLPSDAVFGAVTEE